MNNDQVQIYVSNLPNNAPEKDIISYLSSAGPIKDWKFNKVQQRCSIESAELAKKFLGTRQFQGRDLKINYDTKKQQNINNVKIALSSLNQEDKIVQMILKLSKDEKQQLLLYLSNLYCRQDQMLLDFFETKPKIAEALVRPVQQSQQSYYQPHQMMLGGYDSQQPQNNPGGIMPYRN